VFAFALSSGSGMEALRADVNARLQQYGLASLAGFDSGGSSVDGARPARGCAHACGRTRERLHTLLCTMWLHCRRPTGPCQLASDLPLPLAPRHGQILSQPPRVTNKTKCGQAFVPALSATTSRTPRTSRSRISDACMPRAHAGVCALLLGDDIATAKYVVYDSASPYAGTFFTGRLVKCIVDAVLPAARASKHARTPNGNGDGNGHGADEMRFYFERSRKEARTHQFHRLSFWLRGCQRCCAVVRWDVGRMWLAAWYVGGITDRRALETQRSSARLTMLLHRKGQRAIRSVRAGERQLQRARGARGEAGLLRRWPARRSAQDDRA
jgi:hypothetical protein